MEEAAAASEEREEPDEEPPPEGRLVPVFPDAGRLPPAFLLPVVFFLPVLASGAFVVELLFPAVVLPPELVLLFPAAVLPFSVVVVPEEDCSVLSEEAPVFSALPVVSLLSVFSVEASSVAGKTAVTVSVLPSVSCFMDEAPATVTFVSAVKVQPLLAVSSMTAV